MVTWQVLRRGDQVAVTFEPQDAEEWRAFRAKALGVAALQELSMALSSTENEEMMSAGEDSTAETQRTRILSLPEAYYAAIDSVLPVDEPLGDLWRRFESSSATFARQFVLYQHFRRLGWAPKPGLNYGAQYVLYRGSATEFHSEYVVYLQDAEDASSWNTIQSLTRVAADVKKTVLLCTVSSQQLAAPTSHAPATDLTFGAYTFHDVPYTVEAIAIRFWDASTADKPASYNFQPQPILPKKPKAEKKNRNKRPKRQLEGGKGRITTS